MSFSTMTEEKIYTVREVATLLRVDPRTIRVMIADGELEAFRVRDEWRVRQSAIDTYMEQNKRNNRK